MVKNQDMKNPTILPKAKKFSVINAERGKKGKMDSMHIKTQPSNGPYIPRLSKI